MFVAVACSECGKPFQVPEAVVGQPTDCPWCQARVLALPIAKPAPQPAPQPEPLPLDDEPPPAADTPRRSRLRLLFWVFTLASVVMIPTATITIGILRYKHGYFTSMEWRQAAPGDGSCTAELLGRPTEDADAGAGQKRYTSEGWYSGTTTWVGWRDLTPHQAELATTKDAWQHLRPIFEVERDRLKSKSGGTVVKDATIRFEEPLTWEVRLDYPGGRVVERAVVMPRGAKPRVYFVGIAGHINPDGPDPQRLFDSFRVTE